MQAVICTRYGSPDVLQMQDIPTPSPQAGQVLIKVQAAVVGPSDCAFRKGEPFIVRLIYGLRKPRLQTQGVEFAGRIEAVGAGVTDFRPGEAVYGISPDRFGAHAEYLCLPVTQPLARQSPQMSAQEAVAICDGALTALTFLRDKAHLAPGQRLLVNGASGAVGAYAVQLGKYWGAHVTGVCSHTNLEMVKNLGADAVIDYTRTDFTQQGQTYDVIFDAVGKRSFGECQAALTPTGLYMTTVPSLGIVLQMLWRRVRGGRQALFAAAGLQQSRANLETLIQLYEAGALRAVIDRTYPLAQIAEAHRYVETERKKGNVVITL